MADGQVPYRDFALEYPPARFPLRGCPLSSPRTRRTATSARSADDGVLRRSRRAADRSRSALGAGPARRAGALAFAALWPLALGSVVLTRFDLWPAALARRRARGLLLAGRDRLGLGALGAAVAAKLYPACCSPLAVVMGLAAARPARGARLRRRSSAACSLAIFLPFSSSRPAASGTLGVQLGAAAAGREPRLGALLARTSVVGVDRDGVEPRLAEPRRRPARTRSPVFSTLLQVARCSSRLDLVRPRPGRPRAAPPRLRRRGRRVHRLRQGALAAVPDLARPARAARPGRPRPRARPACSLVGARADAASGSRTATGS